FAVCTHRKTIVLKQLSVSIQKRYLFIVFYFFVSSFVFSNCFNNLVSEFIL
ncbi:hypothetical protein L9F63_028373, partial [Diploptera punctata]